MVSSKQEILRYWKDWHLVEDKIKVEMDWLRRSVETFLVEEKHAPRGCRECFLRRIAILIVSGRVKATEITRTAPLKSFWRSKNSRNCEKYRGGDWHKKTTQKIDNHFRQQYYKTALEPNLYWGRADLGVFKKDKLDLYVEVGTTSFFKLWINLEQMKSCVYLIVPNDDKIIEFVC